MQDKVYEHIGMHVCMRGQCALIYVRRNKFQQSYVLVRHLKILLKNNDSFRCLTSEVTPVKSALACVPILKKKHPLTAIEKLK